MPVFYVIIATMLLGDLAWWYWAHRHLSNRGWRIAAGVFALGQLLGLIAILVSRRDFLSIEEYIPRWWSSMILVWHLLILTTWMIWRLVRGLLVGISWIARRGSHTAAPTTGALAVESLPVETAISRRDFLTTAAVFTPPLFAIGSAAIGEQQLEEFRIRRMDIGIADLPPALDGLTIAHVTDVHVGRFTRGKVLERIVEATNGLNADVVALTGDLINDSLRAMPAALDLTNGLRAKQMVVTCEGNHDLIENPRIFYREAERGGLPLLRGEAAEMLFRGQKVQILGLPWARNEEAMERDAKALLAKRDPSAWPLVLAHHPHAWDHLEGIPLTLAGHTHGGQLMLNERVGAGSWIYRYWSGRYRKENRTLVVSNGTGNWFPVRIQAPAEIIHMTLRRQPA